jgi:hypothetical protein
LEVIAKPGVGSQEGRVLHAINIKGLAGSAWGLGDGVLCLSSVAKPGVCMQG